MMEVVQQVQPADEYFVAPPCVLDRDHPFSHLQIRQRSSKALDK
jgi:hypothetical protein